MYHEKHWYFTLLICWETSPVLSTEETLQDPHAQLMLIHSMIDPGPALSVVYRSLLVCQFQEEGTSCENKVNELLCERITYWWQNALSVKNAIGAIDALNAKMLYVLFIIQVISPLTTILDGRLYA